MLIENVKDEYVSDNKFVIRVETYRDKYFNLFNEYNWFEANDK